MKIQGNEAPDLLDGLPASAGWHRGPPSTGPSLNRADHNLKAGRLAATSNIPFPSTIAPMKLIYTNRTTADQEYTSSTAVYGHGQYYQFIPLQSSLRSCFPSLFDQLAPRASFQLLRVPFLPHVVPYFSFSPFNKDVKVSSRLNKAR